MAPRSQAFRSLLRTSTSTIRASSTTAPTQFQTPLSLTHLQRHSHTQSHPRSRSPSPPPPYQARNITLLASPNQWTRFNTPYNLSSVRTFTSTPRIQWPNEGPESPSTDPLAAKRIEDAIEKIQELYGTARDEFEIAVEETEKNTTYAPDDRAAAREELDKLLEFYRAILEGDPAVAEEVKRRVGQRIRELEQAVIAMEEAAMHGD